MHTLFFQRLCNWFIRWFRLGRNSEPLPAYMNAPSAKSVVRTASRLLRLLEAHSQATTSERRDMVRIEMKIVHQRLVKLGVPPVKNNASLRRLANGEKA